MSNVSLPSPLYAGNAVTTGVTFSVPVIGEDPASWPPTDPSTVTLTFIAGEGATPTVWTYGGAGNITKVSTGVYQAELDTTGSVGPWAVKWVGTGTCAAVWLSGFPVAPLPF